MTRDRVIFSIAGVLYDVMGSKERMGFGFEEASRTHQLLCETYAEAVVQWLERAAVLENLKEPPQ